MNRFWKFLITTALSIMSVVSLISYFDPNSVSDAKMRLGAFVSGKSSEVATTITESPILTAFLYFGSIIVMLILTVVAIFMLFMLLKRD